MTITLDLTPDVEKKLVAQAREHGLSLNDYLREIVTREASLPVVSTAATARNLSDLLLNSPFAGANLDLDRNCDFPRQIELE